MRADGLEVPALVVGDAVVALDEAALATGFGLAGFPDVLTLLRHWDEVGPTVRSIAARATEMKAAGELRGVERHNLAAPIPRPGKVICIGRNYAEHAHELGNDVPSEPMIFAKYATAVTGPFDPIPRPAFVHDMDYEAELVVVVGRGGRDIDEAVALEHVFGYCCANDVSARTAQMATGQFVRGKSFDGFCPMGPAILTADEVDDVQDLRITCRVDGDVLQDARTSSMIFPVARLLAHCSAGTTLEPGDVILTGTPSGVAMGRDPSPWLEPGQVCEVEIEGVGRIANPITAG